MRAQEAERLKELEHEGWEALTRGRAREFYGDLLAEGAVMVFPFGVMGRDEAIDAMAEAPPWREAVLDDVVVHDLGAGLAVVTSRVQAHREDETPFEAVLSSTYVRAGRGWRLLIHQQSP